jgi:hypothetical protein
MTQIQSFTPADGEHERFGRSPGAEGSHPPDPAMFFQPVAIISANSYITTVP